MSRTFAREDAFKLIFEMRVTGLSPEAAIAYLCETADANNDMWAQDRVTKVSLEYIQNVVFGVEKETEEINSIIEPKLKNWTIDRISKVDISILQLAVYEIIKIDDIPEKVSVNEAVQLAKKYGSEKSPAFINGVLGAVLNDKENDL